MKQCLFILSLAFGMIANGQISISYSDYPQIGDIAVYDTTYNGGLTVGASGASVVWDFSSLSGNYNATRSYTSPSSSTYSAAFPSANMVIQEGGTETFLDVSSSKVEIIGMVMDLGLGVNTPIPFTNTLTSINFPTNYNDTFNDGYSFDITIDGGSMGMDSMNMNSSATTSSSIDAFGQLITPSLDTIDCLREYVVHTATTNVLVKDAMLTMGAWTQVQTTNTTDYSYTWVALGYGAGVMETTTDASGNVQTVKLAQFNGPLVSVEEKLDNYLKVRTDINNSFAAIEWNPEYLATSINVLDYAGRLILKSEPKNTGYEMMSLSNLSNGQYIIQVFFGSNVINKKIMVQ